MSKEDEEINCLNCDFCYRLLIEPIKLPCGNTICNSHIVLNHENVIECMLCYDNHHLLGNALKRLNLENIDLNFNQVVKVFSLTKWLKVSECKQRIEEARQNTESLKSLAINPELFINERFDLLKMHINLRRQDLKNEIDKYTDELIESVEQNRLCCIQLSDENYQMEERIDNSRLELEELRKHLSDCEVNNSVEDIRFMEITKNAEDLENKLSQMLAEFKNSLLLNKDYQFVLFDRPLEDVLGKVIDKNKIEPTDELMEEEPEKETQHKTQQKHLEGALEGSEIEIESQATSSWQSQSQLELSFQESDDTSSISESHTESFKKQFEQTGQFIDERRETEEEQLQEPSQGIPNNSLIIQQSPLKFRLKKSYNPKRLNSYPQLAFQGNIYLFLRKAKSLECLNYRCKNMKHCKGKMHVSYDHKVIKQKAHSCNGCIDNATIIQENFTELKENQLKEFNFDRNY